MKTLTRGIVPICHFFPSSELASPVPHPLPPPLRRDNMVRRSMYNFPPPSRNSTASSVCSSKGSSRSSKGSSRLSDFAGRRASAFFMSMSPSSGAASARSRPRSVAMQMRPTSTGYDSSVGELLDSFERRRLFLCLNC